MYKAIVFDFDGVITDGIPFHDQAYLNIYRSLGLDVSMDYLHTKIGQTPAEVLNGIRDKFHISFDAQELMKQHHAEVFKLYQSRAVPSPNLGKFLAKCQQAGLVLGLASSTHSEILNMVLNKFHIKEYFTIIIGGEAVSKGKPDPDMIRQALSKLKINAENSIAIDDAQSGLDAAKSIGMFTIAYTPYSKVVPTNADMMVKDFLDVDFGMLK
jgi:beta-phosphoglucomutase